MVGAQPAVERAETFVGDQPNTQKADCIIGIMVLDEGRYSRTHTVTLLDSVECWDTAQEYATRNWDRGTGTSDMDRHMFVWVFLEVIQDGSFYVVCRTRGEFQSVCPSYLNESCRE